MPVKLSLEFMTIVYREGIKKSHNRSLSAGTNMSTEVCSSIKFDVDFAAQYNVWGKDRDADIESAAAG